METRLQGGALFMSGLLVWYIFFYSGSPRPLKAPYNFYDLKIEGIDGEIICFNQFRGKKVLLVNTASYCGFTHQYEKLEQLHQKYKDEVIVLGLPSNQFFMQEPQSNEKIKEFCEEYYKVTFPMTKKIAVKGRNQHSIYQRLTNKELNNKKDSIILRNFQKYLVSETGELIEIFKPYVDPLDEKIRKHFNTN